MKVWLAGAVALLPELLDAALTHSVRCTGQRRCALVQGDMPDADVTGRFYDELNQTGWTRLFVKSKAITETTGFAAGYLEGALTAHRLVQHLQNYKASLGLDPLPEGVAAFVNANEAWTQEQLTNADPKDAYWGTVRFMVDMRDGIRAGANAHLDKEKQLSKMDAILLPLIGDIGDIKTAANVTEAAEIAAMTNAELLSYQQLRGHCSAIVKLTPDGSELFVGHNTWWEYAVMLRVWKNYDFGGMTSVSMPSYPGSISSIDDFYQMGNGLVVTETTIGNFNNDLLLKVKPQSLPFWLRVMVANFKAQSGPDWMETFQKHNSGTYNNLWMVIDYSKFKPGEPLVEGLFTVGEQIPDYFHYEDQTRVLSYGYWPSYNIALYPEVRKQTGSDRIEETRGAAFSYQRAARANIFRRDQGTINTDADMQRIMRYNKFQTDPLADANPCNQLACRGDLFNGTTKKAFGAIDAKFTSYAHVLAQDTVAISGPTYDDQIVFDWSTTDPIVSKTLHLGMPDRYKFDWMLMSTDMHSEATFWAGTRSFIAFNTVIVAVIGGIALILAAPALARHIHWGKLGASDSVYHKFDVSPSTKMGHRYLAGSDLQPSPGQCSTRAGSRCTTSESMYSPPTWDAKIFASP